MSIAIVTDSTSDISSQLAYENDIHVVPAVLIMDGRSLEDGQGISREEFYRQLPLMKTLPTTAAPASGAFQRLYESLFEQGIDQIISIHVSSLLSGMYNAVVVAAKAFGKRVLVVDSGQVTLGLGFQAIAAAEAVKAGHSLENILKVIEETRRRIHLVAMLDTLEYVRRSGRVSWARYGLGTLLQLKSFVGVKDGTVVRMGETRTRSKGIERLYDLLTDLGPLERLAILHTNAEADAVQMFERFKSFVSRVPLIINVTSIIGTHVGPSGLGFVAVTE